MQILPDAETGYKPSEKLKMVLFKRVSDIARKRAGQNTGFERRPGQVVGVQPAAVDDDDELAQGE